jgi:hypothetical protein
MSKISRHSFRLEGALIFGSKKEGLHFVAGWRAFQPIEGVDQGAEEIPK